MSGAVLTVRKIGSLQAADYSQYLVGRAEHERDAWQEKGDYYTGDGAAGEWTGDASTLEAIGAQPGQEVEREALARALRGQRIDTGEQLRRPGSNGVVNSHDLTMGAPKSVSVLWAQSGPEQRVLIEHAMRDAAEHTVRYMALTTSCVQRRDESGERVWEPASGVASAHFVHHTARATHGNAIPDPHLHVHCVVVAAERSDGQIVTPNQAAWMRHGREGGAFFRAELASRLQEIGLEIDSGTGKDGRFFEVAGVPGELCGRLSGRTAEVDAQRAAFVKQYGRLPRDAELADLAIKSREQKTAHTVADLEPYWRSVCSEHGFDHWSAQQVWDRGHAVDVGASRREVAERLPEWIADKGATVRSREARAMAYELAAGRLTGAEAMRLVDELQRGGKLIALSDDRVTTSDVRGQEDYILISVSDRGASPAHGVSDRSLGVGIAEAERVIGGTLTGEQRAATELLVSDARIAALTGPAGTGKGAVIRAASEALKADGRTVVATATQGATANRLGGQAGVPAYTIDGLAARVRHERISLDERSVIMVDESGMVDTDRLATLFEIADTYECQLRLIGDPEQLQPIGAGGLFETVCEQVPTAELVEIHRTHDQWMRDAQTAIREARSADALGILKEHDAAHMLGTHREAMQQMVDDWSTWRHDYAAGDTLMVVHTTNADVDTVNMLAQAKRLEAGELGAEGVKAPDRAYELHAGDRVMLRTAPYTFEERDEPRVENGTRGTIVDVGAANYTVRVAVEEPSRAPRTVEIDLDRCRALRLDYASHVYPAQGDTRSRTAELTGGPGTTKEAAYVGGTRLRERHDLYTSREALGTDGTDADRWTRLAEQMDTSQRQVPSVAFREADRAIAATIPASPLDVSRAQLAAAEAQLEKARDHVKQLESTYPFRIERQITDLEQRALKLVDWERNAQRRLQLAQRREDAVPIWKRAERQRARDETERHGDTWDRNRRELHQTREQLARLRNGPDTPQTWRAAHGADLAAREESVQKLTVARGRLRDRTADLAIERPPGYLTRALGPRPTQPDERRSWNEAAGSVERFRLDNRITSRVLPIGPRPVAFHRQPGFDGVQNAMEKARRALSPARTAQRYMRMISALTQFVAAPDEHGHERGHPGMGRNLDRGHGHDLW